MKTIHKEKKFQVKLFMIWCVTTGPSLELAKSAYRWLTVSHTLAVMINFKVCPLDYFNCSGNFDSASNDQSCSNQLVTYFGIDVTKEIDVA